MNKKKNNKSRENNNQRRRDNRALKNAGIWEDPRDKYLNKNGTPKTDIIIPVWFLNLYKTWNYGTTSKKEAWDIFCKKSINNADIDPNKKKVGRPKLPNYMKKNTTKIKRSDKMKQLLLDNNIHLIEEGKYGPKYLSEYPKIRFLENGRLELENKTRISVFQFLKNLAAS